MAVPAPAPAATPPDGQTGQSGHPGHRGTRAIQRMVEHAPSTGGLALWVAHRDLSGDAMAERCGSIDVPIATDGEWVIYGPAFERRPLPEQTGLVAHEVLHIALRHPQRYRELQHVMGDVDLQLYNLCADAVVNSALSHLGWLALPAQAITLDRLLAQVLGLSSSAEVALLEWDVERLYRAVDDRRVAMPDDPPRPGPRVVKQGGGGTRHGGQSASQSAAQSAAQSAGRSGTGRTGSGQSGGEPAGADQPGADPTRPAPPSNRQGSAATAATAAKQPGTTGTTGTTGSAGSAGSGGDGAGARPQHSGSGTPAAAQHSGGGGGPRRVDGQRAARLRSLGGQTPGDLLPPASAPGEPQDEAEQTQRWGERVARAHAGDGAHSMLRALLADLPRSHTPWEQLLRTQLTRSLAPRPELSWSRPTRSYLANQGRQGDRAARRLRMPWEPGQGSTRAVPRLVLIVDVSGSIGAELLERFSRETVAILRRLEAGLVLVIGDDQVRRVETLAPAALATRGFNLADYTVHGGGGTDFTPLLEEAERHRPDIAVVLTDLQGPVRHRPHWPVLWAVPEAWAAAVQPFGRKIVLR